MTPLILAGAEPETIDRGCPVQINRMFGSKENLFFTVRPLFFSEPRGRRLAPTLVPPLNISNNTNNITLKKAICAYIL
jgi:hypothetical protein